jgi:hypothetical protein
MSLFSVSDEVNDVLNNAGKVMSFLTSNASSWSSSNRPLSTTTRHDEPATPARPINKNRLSTILDCVRYEESNNESQEKARNHNDNTTAHGHTTDTSISTHDSLGTIYDGTKQTSQ